MAGESDLDLARERRQLNAEVAQLREELDHDLYRLARRSRALADKVPFAIPAAKAVYHLYGEARDRFGDNKAESRWVSSLDPDLDYPLRDRWMNGGEPRASIVVLAYNRGPLTLRCLHALWMHTEGADYEIVLVDNGSRPRHFRMLRPYAAHFREVALSTNRYFGEGNNIGAEASHGSIVVFLNNDVLVRPRWLSPLVAALADPTIGAVGSRLLFADGRVQETGGLVTADGSSLQVERGAAPNDVEHEGLADVDYCSAACLALPKATFQAVGGFDYCYEPAYYEDTDLCFKVRALGLRVVCARASQVTHLEHSTTARRSRRLDLRGQPEFNRLTFLARWAPVLRGDVPIEEMSPASDEPPDARTASW